MKRKNKNSKLKIILAVEAILLVLACVGVVFVVANSDTPLSGMIFPPTQAMSAPTIMNSPTNNILIPVTLEPNTAAGMDAPTVELPTFTPTVLSLQNNALGLEITPVVLDPIFVPATVESSGLPSTVLSAQDNTFSLQNMNTVLPEDIIKEIGFFGGMGGCGRFCSCINASYAKPELIAEGNIIEIMKNLGFEVCGLSRDERVLLTVDAPNGKSSSFETISVEITHPYNTVNEAIFEYIPNLGDHLGNYRFTFSGNNWEIQKNILVVDVSSPKLYRDQNLLIFYKFQPNENVRVFAYQNLSLTGWKEYRVDPNGNLNIILDIGDSYLDLVAVGDISGQVFQQFKGEWEWTDWLRRLGSSPNIYCAGAPNPVGLDPDGFAVVIVDKLPYSGTLRNADGSETKINGELSKDTYVGIVSNASCENRQFHWNVGCLDKSCDVVTVPEGGLDGYYLQPVDPASVPLTPTPEIPPCPGTKPTRLQIGMNAEVTTSGKAPQLTLREQPSMNTKQVHVIAAGRDMVILEGPVCAENSYWWRIRSEQGFEGWAREGDHEDYWIDPLP